jgi:hypothetical protein
LQEFLDPLIVECWHWSTGRSFEKVQFNATEEAGTGNIPARIYLQDNINSPKGDGGCVDDILCIANLFRAELAARLSTFCDQLMISVSERRAYRTALSLDAIALGAKGGFEESVEEEGNGGLHGIKEGREPRKDRRGDFLLFLRGCILYTWQAQGWLIQLILR